MKPTDPSLVSEFLSMAQAARDDHAKVQCQSYFLQNLVGDAETREDRQQAFLHAAGKIAGAFDQAADLTCDSYDAVIARIPETQTGVRHALRKVALNLGLIDAPGWGGK